MLFHPAQLGLAHLDKATLEADKKACKKIGPCGVGKKALYLNSFYIDRRYYLPYGSISRVFKRVAMSQGGFSGKGMFASMAYLVVEYDGGKQKQLSKEAEQSVGQLKRASDYLAKKPELAKELSAAERRKRAQLQSKPVYKYVALIISLFGVVSAAYGIQSIINHTGNYGIYFALFGFAAIFLFSSYNMMPTAHNNRNAIMKRADRAEAAMAEYIKAYPGGNFPVPDIYAHPVVLKQMTDALQEGRAVTLPEALEAVKNRLKEVNADVQVEQEEYDEIVQIKAMFLNHDYQ